MIANAALNDSSFYIIIFSVGALLFGAKGAFFQLKRTINDVWNDKEKKSTILVMLKDRMISFGMILVVGLMLLVSMVISATISTVSEYVKQIAPDITYTLEIVNFLFASIFKILSDMKIRWEITLLGVSVTAIHFLIGEYLLRFYFGQSNPA